MVGHLGDEPGVDAVASVGKDRVGRDHLHGRDCASAQRHGQVGGVFVGIKAEVGDPVLCVAGADGLQDADGDHVLGLGKRAAQRHGALKRAVVVLGLPGLATGGASVEEQRCVVHHRSRGEAFFQRGGIDEGLEAGTRLAPCLGDVVELVFAEVKTAHQRLDGAVARVHGDKGAFHLGQLGGFPGVLGGLCHADHGTRADADIGRGFVAEPGLDRAQAFAGNFDVFAVAAQRHDLLGVDFRDHSGHQVAVVGVLQQYIVDGLVQFLGVLGQGDEFLGATVDLAPFIVHDAAPQRLVGGVLVGGIERGVDVQTPGVGFPTVLGIDHLAHHLGHVFRMHARAVGAGTDLQFLCLGCLGLFGGDEAVVLHPLDDVELA